MLIDSAGLLAAVLRGCQGIAWSLTFAAGMSLVADVAPPERLGHAIGLYGAAALATSALGPAVAEPIANTFGPRPLFLLSAVIGLIGALVLPPALPRRGDVGADVRRRRRPAARRAAAPS